MNEASRIPNDRLAYILIAVVAFLVYANTLGHGFVYDDSRQILMNPLIQRSELYGKALTSDVWAFKGDGSIPASNYWRPVFTAWSILNFRLFGFAPTGWHLLNVLLHVAVCIVGFRLLRRWQVPTPTASVIVLLFAVHPVHTESVAWIAGSPDILLALFLLLSLLFADLSADGERNKTSTRNLLLSVLFYALALGSKEVAIVCAPIYLLIFARERDRFWKAISDRKAWLRSAPFFGAAAVYFLLRIQVIGAVVLPVPDSTDTSSTLLSVPSVFLFYFRQIVFPAVLGPNYPLRPITEPGLMDFVLPVAGCLLVLAIVLWAIRRSFVRRVGAALLFLPLLPVLRISSFPTEQIVHDRYLYLSLFGFLIIAITLIAESVRGRWPQGDTYVLAASFPLILVLGYQTYAYNKVWQSDLALWSHAVTVDAASAHNWRELGAELNRANNPAPALEALDRSIQIRPSPSAYMLRGRVAMVNGDLTAAVGDFEKVLSMPLEELEAYGLYQTYESLAVAHQHAQDYPDAERRLREARDRLPIYRASLTEKLAVILYLQNRKEEALRELENVRPQARREMLPGSKSVFLRLGMLYAELGRKAEARAALEEFLTATSNSADPHRLADRRVAADLLRTLR